MKLIIFALICLYLCWTNSYTFYPVNDNYVCYNNKLNKPDSMSMETSGTCEMIALNGAECGDTTNHLPQCDCNYAIKALSHDPTEDVKQKKIVSSELMCMECNAVAKYLNKTISDYLESVILETPFNDLNENEIKNVLSTSCKNGFKNYRMKEKDETVFLDEKSHPATTLPTHMDNLWQTELKTMCCKLVDHLNLSNFYATVTKGKPSTQELFCKSTVFPYCKNIESNETANEPVQFSIQLYIQQEDGE